MARPRQFDRNKALDKAMLVFWQNGYEATFLDDLTRAMGINRPSLYNAFGDKHALYMEALERYRALYGGKMLSALERAPTLKAGFERIFVNFIEEATERCCRGCMIVNSTVEGCAISEEVAAFIAETDRASKRAFAAAIENAQQKGELSLKEDRRRSPRISTALFKVCRYALKRERTVKVLEAIAKLALSVLD